jgi:hypothetical protein
MTPLQDIINEAKDLKIKAKNRRDMERYDKAVVFAKQAITSLEDFLKTNDLLSEKEVGELNTQLADCYGIEGGIYRRWGLIDQSFQNEKFKLSIESYDKGYEYEKKGSQANSYNMLNRLIGRILSRPDLLDESEKEDSSSLIEELKECEQKIQKQLSSERKGDIWALADEGLLKILLKKEDPIIAFSSFVNKAPDSFAYNSLISTLKLLAALNTPRKMDLFTAIDFLEKQTS